MIAITIDQAEALLELVGERFEEVDRSRPVYGEIGHEQGLAEASQLAFLADVLRTKLREAI